MTTTTTPPAGGAKNSLNGRWLPSKAACPYLRPTEEPSQLQFISHVQRALAARHTIQNSLFRFPATGAGP